MKFFFNKRSKSAPATEKILPLPAVVIPVNQEQDEIAAVIALSVHMYVNQMRDYENSVITIQKIMKPYSPWSSKIYGLRPQLVHTASIRPGIRKS